MKIRHIGPRRTGHNVESSRLLKYQCTYRVVKWSDINKSYLNHYKNSKGITSMMLLRLLKMSDSWREIWEFLQGGKKSLKKNKCTSTSIQNTIFLEVFHQKISIKVEGFKKVAWIQSHHLQWKFKFLAGKFTSGNKAKHLKVTVMWLNPGYLFKKNLLY